MPTTVERRGTMRIISSVEDQDVIETILKYLGLYLIRSKPPAKTHEPPSRKYTLEGLKLREASKKIRQSILETFR